MTRNASKTNGYLVHRKAAVTASGAAGANLALASQDQAPCSQEEEEEDGPILYKDDSYSATTPSQQEDEEEVPVPTGGFPAAGGLSLLHPAGLVCRRAGGQGAAQGHAGPAPDARRAAAAARRRHPRPDGRAAAREDGARLVQARAVRWPARS